MPNIDLKEKKVTSQVIDLTIKLVVLYAIVAWCFSIVAPFVSPVMWAIIIAVAIYPLHEKLTILFKGRAGRAAAFFAILTISLFIIPIVLVSASLIDSVKDMSSLLVAGELHVPAPNESVATWPIIGEKLYDFWLLASQNLESALLEIKPQLSELGSKLVGITVGGGLAIVQFIFAVIVAAMFLANSDSGKKVAHKLSQRLTGEQGDNYVALATATIRSVAQGVLGIAFIQALLAGLGLVVVGVPFAGIWTVAVLFIAIIQLPPIIILAPIIAYVFSVSPSTEAIIFTVWCIAVSTSDAFLKPLLLGRGVDVPMVVILMGAIGGMIMSGIIGLFVGAVILSVGYKLLVAWINNNVSKKDDVEDVT